MLLNFMYGSLKRDCGLWGLFTADLVSVASFCWRRVWLVRLFFIKPALTSLL